MIQRSSEIPGARRDVLVALRHLDGELRIASLEEDVRDFVAQHAQVGLGQCLRVGNLGIRHSNARISARRFELLRLSRLF